MSRTKRWLRRWLARLLDRWEEGPDAPRRLSEEARLFRHYYPNATADEWERFAVTLANGTYRQAFVRGFEWNERCWPGPEIDPDAVAVFYGHDVSVGDNSPNIRQLLQTVPRGISDEQLKLIRQLAESPYQIRIEFKPEEE